LAVYQRAPNAKKMMDHFGLRDLFLDMIDRPDIFLICTSLEGAMYHRYMMEKHGRKIYPERCFSGAYFRVYRIHSHPPGTPCPPAKGLKPMAGVSGPSGKGNP
jgi:hypothetical protein